MGARVYKTRWPTDYWFILLSNPSTCLHARLPLRLRLYVCVPAHTNHHVCVVAVSQLTCETMCLPTCLSVRLCLRTSLQSQASLAVTATSCHVAQGWSAGVFLRGREEGFLSLIVHAGDNANQTQKIISHEQTIMSNELTSRHKWNSFFVLF